MTRDAPLSWRFFPRIQRNLREVGFTIESEDDLNELTQFFYEQRLELSEIAEIYGIAQKTIQNHIYAMGKTHTMSEAQSKGWRYFATHQRVLRKKGVIVLTPDDLDQWCKDQYEKAFWSPAKIAKYIESTKFTVKRHLQRCGTHFRVAGGASGTGFQPPFECPIPEEDRDASPYTPGQRLVIATPAQEFEATFCRWYTTPQGVTCIQIKHPRGCFDIRNIAVDSIQE